MLSHYPALERIYAIKVIGNFFEKGEGKNDLDAHFGNMSNMEKKYLVKHDIIKGAFGLEILTVRNFRESKCLGCT